MTIKLDDMGMESVHVDSATTSHTKPMSITAAKRESIPKSEFAVPGKRKYPVDTAARTRNAAARLEQNKSGMSSAEYSSAKAKIAAAARKFGIKSEYNDKRPSRRRRGLHMKIAADGGMTIRHMSELGSGLAFMPPVEIQVAGLED